MMKMTRFKLNKEQGFKKNSYFVGVYKSIINTQSMTISIWLLFTEWDTVYHHNLYTG